MALRHKLAHFFAGAISSISVVIHPVMPAVSFAGFLSYELVEYYINKDKPWIDILEYMVGFYSSVTGLIIYTIWNRVFW